MKLALSTAIIALCFAASPLFAAPQPKLIVVVAVDQFSSDVFNEYRGAYAAGLKRLASGVVFPRGHQSHAATETCPGHATILTGSRPARSGIIANDWMNPALTRTDAKGQPTNLIYCAEDPAAKPPAGTPYMVSSQFLRVPTLGDRMKAAGRPVRIVSVAGKDRAAVMMGGHQADLTLWWDGKAFATYAGKDATIPASVTAVSARASAQIAAGSAQKLPAQCASRARRLKLSDAQSVGTLMPVKPGDERRWRASPGLDTATMDAALAATETLALGRGSGTDVLAIGLSGTDYVGHTYGTAGAELCAQIMNVDALLGRLFATLDKAGIDYAVLLTADHGGHDLPERNVIQGLPAAQRVDPKLAASAMGKAIAEQMGLAGSALLGRASFGDIYVSHDVPQDRRSEALGLAVAAYRAHPQVAAVFTHEELASAPAPHGPVDEWSLLDRAKAGHDPERSGDLVVLLKPYVTPIADPGSGYVATHGSPWGYDRRVPMLFWWKGIAGFEQPNAVETIDILPTLASLIALDVPPAQIDGRCLDLIAGPDNNCTPVR